MTWLAMTLLCVNAVLLVVGLLVIYPRYQRSVFRYELWQLRDDLWDAIRRDEFGNKAAAKDLLRQIENAIKYSDIFTAREIIPLYLALGRQRWRILARSFQQSKGESHTIELDSRLLEFDASYRQTIAKRISRSSFFGLSLRLSLFAVVFAKALRTRREVPESARWSSRENRAAVEESVDGKYVDMFVQAERRDLRERSLAACIS